MAFPDNYNIVQLKSRDSFDIVPRTSDKAVTCEDGGTLNDKLQSIETTLDPMAETLNILATAHRGYSFINVTTTPTNDASVGKDRYYKSVVSVKSESGRDDVVIGDTLVCESFLYAIIGYKEASQTNYALLRVGTIKGDQGNPGIQGIQGIQGPKGDPGEGYFILRDEDYTIIADMVEEKSYHAYDRADSSEPIRPNIFYRFGPQYMLEITFARPSSEYRSNEYMFEFVSPSDRPTALVLPSSVKWCFDPVIEAGKTYQVSVLDDLAVMCGA